MGVDQKIRSRDCDSCGKEGQPAGPMTARTRFINRVQVGAIPAGAKFEDYDWLQCCGSAPWAAPKKEEPSETA